MPELFPGASRLVHGSVENGVWLLVGPQGAGKSSFAKQFIWDGLKDGIPSVYALVDDSPDATVKSMGSLGFDVKSDVDEGRLAMVDLYSRRSGEQSARKLAPDPDNLSEVCIELEKARRSFPKSRFVMDTVTSLLMNSSPAKGQRVMQVIASRFRQSGTGLLIMEEGIPDPAFLNFFRYIFDGVFEMKVVDTAEGLQRYFRVFSLKGVKHDTTWVPYTVTETGLRWGEEESTKKGKVEEGRRLAAIMFTDVVGYTAMMQKDEGLTLRLLEDHRRLLRSIFPGHHGREIKTMGDAFLVEFDSANEAADCAIGIQTALHELSEGRAGETTMKVRVGIHLGDVEHREGDVYGDAVNIASRIQPLAPSGGICITRQVFDHIRNRTEFPIVEVGRQGVKNVAEPIETYRIMLPWEEQR